MEQGLDPTVVLPAAKRVTKYRLKWTCHDFVDTLLRYGLPQRILFILGWHSVAQVRV